MDLRVNELSHHAEILRNDQKGWKLEEIIMGTSTVLISALRDNAKGSYVDYIKRLYTIFSFTSKQKLAAEVFIFNPTYETAIEALRQTPKMYVLLEDYLDQKTLLKAIVKIVEDENTSRTYLRALFTQYYLKPTLEQLLRMKLPKIRAYDMEMKLKGLRVT